ncbi:hypothetical protein [Xanthomonas albilineans]|uniref:hypothetical protein n=1 Tax=Xanthomonas albilineans TaxID=29447 RepID=UPI0006965542|nr:hypothetical protein [Xanthomonas albilineans]
MAAEHWFRWHHGTVNDPKWRVVAVRASSLMSRNVTVGHVLSVWACMLECASQSIPRGMLAGWDDEDVAAGLGMDVDEVYSIRVAMQGKTLEDDTLSGWKSRQPKAEDLRAADRKRAQRERESAAERDVTKGDGARSHVMSRNVTTETETETEENQNLSSSAAPSDPAGDELAQRLAQVTRDALAAYNASPLTKRNGGNLPNASETLGREKRQQQVRRCLRVAREICRESTGSPLVTPEFWIAYFDLVAQDDFYAGRVRGGNGHENFVPDFETLTAEKTMLRLYDRQVAA